MQHLDHPRRLINWGLTHIEFLQNINPLIIDPCSGNFLGTIFIILAIVLHQDTRIFQIRLYFQRFLGEIAFKLVKSINKGEIILLVLIFTIDYYRTLF